MTEIKFKITPFVKSKIESALRKSGDFETGGILIGRKIEDNFFEIFDVSVSDEDNRYSISSFFRGIKKTDMLLRSHFRDKTGYYIGEWHSHPKFSLSPSQQDIATMQGILADENYGISFAVLIITKIHRDNLEYQGYYFHEDLNKVILLEKSPAQIKIYKQ